MAQVQAALFPRANEVMAPPRACRHLLALLLALAETAEARRHIERGTLAAARAGELRTVPKLSPKSDSLFFRHDFPDDLSPTAPLETDFDHPYPVVQESDKFDRDFVKDENSDRGEWQAQVEYDRLRTQMRELARQEEKARERKEELERELEAASAREKEVRDRRKQLREHGEDGVKDGATGGSETEHEMKGGKETKPVQGSSGKGSPGVAVDVSGATKEVEKELKDIEECKRRLAEAHAKLQALREEQKEVKEEERKAADSERAAEKVEAASEKEEAEAEGRRRGAQVEHEDALGAYRTERGELEDLEGRLEKAQARLLKLRSAGVDRNGGVYKSEARRGGVPAGIALLCVWSAVVATVLADP
uniref:Uncharacterized protein n=1 Tax=Alexandrium monilatum TaxID=311494 RepID=A0A7S4SVK0_9DINO